MSETWLERFLQGFYDDAIQLVIIVVAYDAAGTSASLCSLLDHSIVASAANAECVNADLVFAEWSLFDDLIRIAYASICEQKDSLLDKFVGHINDI